MSISTAKPRVPDLCGHAVDGRYELEAVIGEGSFGRVYRGYDRRLARAVAVKVIKPWWAEDPEWVARFEREAQLMARVGDPGIVQIFDVGQADDGLYHVAELVEGESLESRLRRGPMPVVEAVDIAEQLCRALAHAHARSVVHGDIKPANVLISRRGIVKVGDFGVARLAEGSSVRATATIAGTPRYMAPEQARGRGTTTASDVYSVGIVLYEMIAGRPPFNGTSVVELALQHVQDSPPPLHRGTPPALARVVEVALAKDPRKRYADGEQMREAVADAARANGARRPPNNGSRRVPTPASSATSRATRGDTSGDTSHTRVKPRGRRGGVAATRVAPKLSERRNVNPAGRRRSIALVAGAIALVVGMVAAAVLIGGVEHVRVPSLHGLTRTAAARKAHRAHLQTTFHTQFSSEQEGTAIAQTPSPRARVGQDSTVTVILSGGPPPVALPQLTGSPSNDAQSELAKLQLRANITEVPAPGATAGTVTREVPAAGTKVSQGSTIALSVAETPRWRPLTSFSGGESVPFTIRGTHWRIVYKMGFQGTCTFIFVCSGPSAHVTNLNKGTGTGSFDLGEGSGQIWTFPTGPGLYQVKITPGSDTATWSAQIQDYY